MLKTALGPFRLTAGLVATVLAASAPAVQAQVSQASVDTIIFGQTPRIVFDPVSATLTSTGPGPSTGNANVLLATGTADLPTGSLRLFARSGEATPGLIGASAAGELRESITVFAGPNTPANVPVAGEVRFTVQGFFNTLHQPTGQSVIGSQDVSVELTSLASLSDFTNNDFASINLFRERGVTYLGNTPSTIVDSRPFGSSSQSVNDPVPGLDFVGSPRIDITADSALSIDVTYVFPFEVLPGSRLDVRADVRVSASSSLGHFVSGNFGNTAFFEVDLPDGYGFTSGSGVFLSQPIPEPAAVASLAVLGLVTLRRRRSALA